MLVNDMLNLVLLSKLHFEVLCNWFWFWWMERFIINQLTYLNQRWINTSLNWISVWRLVVPYYLSQLIIFIFCLLVAMTCNLSISWFLCYWLYGLFILFALIALLVFCFYYFFLDFWLSVNGLAWQTYGFIFNVFIYVF